MGLLQLERVAIGEVGLKPGTLKMLTTDNLATITTAGYLNNNGNQLQALNIAPSDIIECLYSYNSITDSGTFALLAVSISNGVITLASGADTEPLPSAQIFVGNASNVAQARAMTGDIAITNTGVTSIVAGVIVNADINAAAAIAFSKLAALPSAQVLVGSAGNVATAVAVTGDVTISNAGVTAIAADSIVNADINSAAAIAYSKLAALPSAQILVGSAGNVATAVAMTGDVAISNAGLTTIQAGAIDLAMLSSGITPSHVIKFAGQPTTVGGAAAEAFAVPGVLVTDLAFVQVVNDGTGNVTVLQAVCTADTLTVTFSANPGNDTVINYQIIRAAA